MMNCEQVRELEGAFALGALETNERTEFLAHLKECGEHDNVAELRAAGILLGETAEEQQPPARLRARVLASAGTSSTRPSRLPSNLVRWWYAAAAAVLLLVVAGAALFATRGSDSGELYVKEFVAADVAVHYEARFDDSYSKATFAGLTPREDYHLWVIRGNDWLSVGTFRANAEGKWSGEFAFQTEQRDTLCLTVGNPSPPATPFGQPLFVEPVS